MALQNDMWTTLRVGALTILALLAASWIWQPEPVLVPRELIGEWHTDDSNYVDRALTIDEATINFGTGEGKVAVGFIDKVKSVPDGNRMLYTITYSLNGESNVVSFYYESAKQQTTIRFKNQQSVVWTKDSSA